MFILYLLFLLPSTFCVEVDVQKLLHEFEVFKHEVNEELRITREGNALLQKKVEFIEQENIELNHRLTSVESKKMSNSIGFFAHLSSDQEVEAAETVVFSIADVNIGDAYNTDSGEFTCPVTGLYYFSFQIHAAGAPDWTVQIIVGDRGFGATYLNEAHTQNCTTTTGVVQCAAGEKVYVRNQCNTYGLAKSICAFCGDQTGVLQSYFNGFLIDLLQETMSF